MFCSNCGKEVKNESKFCGNCGSQVLTATKASPAAPPPRPEVRQASSASMPEMGKQEKMTFSQVLFSYEGRIPRSVYWGYAVPFGILNIIVYLILFSKVDPALRTIIVLNPYRGQYIGLLSIAWWLLCLYPGLAIAVKRLHDRNRSGWFILIGFIPIVNIWLLIEVLFLKGTNGSNKYGYDQIAN